MSDNTFDEAHVLHELKHYLPSQTPLKDFIHHNSLHAFQGMKFHDAIFKAAKIFGYQPTLQLTEYRELFKIGRIKNEVLDRIIIETKGTSQAAEWKHNLLHKEYDTANLARIGLVRANWKSIYKIDLDNLVQPLLFRILCSYLDQGISMWKFPVKAEGFLSSIKELEKNSFTSFFKTSRAKQLLLSGNHAMSHLLKIIVGEEVWFKQYLFDQQFSHRGWSGMAGAVEDSPHTLLDPKAITLHDLIIFELLLEIDTLDFQFGKNWKPLCSSINTEPINLFSAVPSTELNEVFTIWQKGFDWSYYDEVLAGLAVEKKRTHKIFPEKSFQAMFCIDERECSLRRHIEFVVPDCETLGTPGFFAVEFYMQPQNAKFYDNLCPAPVTPKYLIKEFDVKEKRKHELLYTNKTHGFFYGFLSTLTLGFFAAIRLVQNIFRPKMSPAISNAFAHMSKSGQLSIENKSLH